MLFYPLLISKLIKRVLHIKVKKFVYQPFLTFLDNFELFTVHCLSFVLNSSVLSILALDLEQEVNH